VTWDHDPRAHADQEYPISADQGELLYVLARAIGARRVVEFATSMGFSTVYLARAVRDNGGGIVVGSELLPEKARRARERLADAGLAEYAEIRDGDGLETLRDAGGPVDLVLLDGWPSEALPSLDRRVLELLLPQLRVGGLVLDDNGEEDVRALMRDPASGLRSAHLPFARATNELAVKVASSGGR
jgi:predicted O-methyltransferase YrrM